MQSAVDFKWIKFIAKKIVSDHFNKGVTVGRFCKLIFIIIKIICIDLIAKVLFNRSMKLTLTVEQTISQLFECRGY